MVYTIIQLLHLIPVSIDQSVSRYHPSFFQYLIETIPTFDSITTKH